MKTALITGVTGQLGSHLASLLLDKGYTVHGIKRRSSLINTGRIDHLFDHRKFHLHYGDVTDGSGLARLITEIQPDELYNTAAQSHVRVSFDCPEYTAESTGLSVLKLLEAARDTKTRVFQCSSSEMFGDSPPPQNETTPFHPRSPYAVSKLFGYWAVRNYREAYGMFACNGILFNTTSESRGETFITRKVTTAAARYRLGLQNNLVVGNLDAKRDWLHAKDTVAAAWLMLQQDKPDDFVVASGVQHSVRFLIEKAYYFAGVEIAWRGSGVDEVGYDIVTGKEIVTIDPKYYRPTEVQSLLGDSTKIRRELGWKPTLDFEDIVKRMYQSDYEKERMRAEPW